jgi:hypothetical protein
MKMPVLLETFGGEMRVAGRGLLKSPGFMAVVVLSLGIAANGTIFSILEAVLYRPTDAIPAIGTAGGDVADRASAPGFAAGAAHCGEHGLAKSESCVRGHCADQ